MNPKLTRFILLFEGRTGSTLLAEMANQHPKVAFLGEEVAEFQPSGWNAQYQWINKLFYDTEKFGDGRIKEEVQSVGFKVKLREIASAKDLKSLIEVHGIKIVYMTRTNLVKQVTSSIRAMDLHSITGYYNLETDKENLKPAAYNIPVNRFMGVFDWIENSENTLRSFIESLSSDIFRITYEDFMSSTNETLQKFFSFVGADSYDGELIETQIKMTSDNLRESVSNLDEIKSYYLGTKYESMFD